MDPGTGTAQSQASIAANTKYFLEHLQEYESSVSQIDTYKTIRKFISERIAGVGDLLDVGNGGVFDYDTAQVRHITAIDLFLGDLTPDLIVRYSPKNAVPRAGSALALPEPAGKFDCVPMVMLLHHLTGATWQESWTNAATALNEGWRCLNRGSFACCEILHSGMVLHYRKTDLLGFIARPRAHFPTRSHFSFQCA